jgi:hypothetical protein
LDFDIFYDLGFHIPSIIVSLPSFAVLSEAKNLLFLFSLPWRERVRVRGKFTLTFPDLIGTPTRLPESYGEQVKGEVKFFAF